jgi:hypothetical protein
MTADCRWKIKVQNGSNVFFYNGLIIDENDFFLWLNDDKDGEIKLNKSFIISMQKVVQ